MINPTVENLDITESEINRLVEIVGKEKVYVALIILDLTSLNEGPNSGREVGTQLKKNIREFFLTHNKVVYEKVIGGKVFFFTQNPLTSGFKKELDMFSREIFNIENKVVFLEEDTIGPINGEFEDIFVNALSKELSLNKLRAKIQKNISEKNLNDIKEEKLNQSILKDSRAVYSIARSSTYLQKAAELNYNDKKNILPAHNFVVKYLIWIELQELLFAGYKTEKINHHIDMENKEFKFTLMFLQDWYKSTIKPLEPYFNESEKKQIKEIENLVLNENLSSKEIKTVIDKIHKFTENLDIKGIFSIPLSNLKYSDGAYQFLRRQLYINYGKEDFEKKLSDWFKSDFIKKNYQICADGSKEHFYNAFRFINPQATTNSPTIMSFLELDGFNAFNNYLFANDSDKVYNKILDIIFETANSFMLKNLQIFRTMSVSIMGDEFFFTFLETDSNAKYIVKEYMAQIRKNIIDITKDNSFQKTEKIDIEVDGGIAHFRKIIENAGRIKVAKLGVSGVIINSTLNQEKFFDDFEFLDKMMKSTKINFKGKLMYYSEQKGFFDRIFTKTLSLAERKGVLKRAA